MIPIEPFSQFPKCVKCGHEGAPWRYGSVNAYVYGNHGELINVAEGNPPPDPHIIVRCYACHYQWLMRPADYDEVVTEDEFGPLPA